ncbi:hypothetical protein KKB44_01430 [Candidatus Micrarchaeota archaeon]|nr:hypothetical protein [Candidatus Micrarchaeota archaeon]
MAGHSTRIIQFPHRPKEKFNGKKPEPDQLAPVIFMPPKVISSFEALSLLGSLVKADLSDLRLGLCFPRRVKFHYFGDGAEVYDKGSIKPQSSDHQETIVQWVKYWYFSITREDDQFLARFMSNFSVAHRPPIELAFDADTIDLFLRAACPKGFYQQLKNVKSI